MSDAPQITVEMMQKMHKHVGAMRFTGTLLIQTKEGLFEIHIPKKPPRKWKRYKRKTRNI